MFDDVKEPEDIFAGTDPVEPPKAPGVGEEKVSVVDPVIKTGPSPLVYIVVAAVVFGAIGGGGYYWWSMRSAESDLPTVGDTPSVTSPTGDVINGQGSPDKATNGPGSVEPDETEPIGSGEVGSDLDATDSDTADSGATEPVNQPEPDSFMDTDGDGLNNDEEIELGTDPEAVDTDNDELSDFDEVRIYKTDPIKPDTDGDGYLDGQEVRGGYNPNGSGKLFEIPTQ